MWRLSWVLLSVLLSGAGAFADSSTPAVTSTAAPTVDGVVRAGVRLRVTAALEGGGVRLRATAESADGAEHRMPSTPIYVNGHINCTGMVDGNGRGFGEGGGGSDGWDVARAVSPGVAPATILDRLMKKELGALKRGCAVKLELRLDRLDGGKVEAPIVAEVTWTRPRPRGEKLELVLKP